MDSQKLNEIIKKMLHPNTTVSSLMMFAKKLEKESLQSLLIFLEASCKIDIYKTAIVAHELQGEFGQAAKEKVYEILATRCNDERNFNHLDLLAIAVYNRPELLTKSSILTKQVINKAFALSNIDIACNLLEMGLVCLDEDPRKLLQKAFCEFLLKNSNLIDKKLPSLIPILIEYESAEVLSLLIDLVGLERIEKIYEKPILPIIDYLIRMGKDSVTFWEIFFNNFFATNHAPQEILEDGLWHIQLYASEDIYNEVCAIFYFYIATNYDTNHPIFEYIEGFERAQKYNRNHIISYKNTIDNLFEQPEVLSDFLNKTSICNPFLCQETQNSDYKLLKYAEDPVSYKKLESLFEKKTSPSVILNIFLSTDLKTNLPFEDMFDLAQRYELLPDFLELVKDMHFSGIITNTLDRTICLLPVSYCVTAVHIMNLSHQANKRLGHNKQRGQSLSYTIKGFEDGHLRITYCGNIIEPSHDTECTTTWETSIQELKEFLCFDEISIEQLQQLSILKFSRDSLINECDFNLFTRLFLEFPNQIYTFLKILDLANWNSGYSDKNWMIKKELYTALKPYRQNTLQLFKVLFSTQNINNVLEVYFSSIYKAILPLNELLFLADKEPLLEVLPKFTFSCNLKEQGSNLCRPKNILCAPICSVEDAENLDETKPFYSFISDFIVLPTGVFRIILTPHSATQNTAEERGHTFGYLSKNIDISNWRTEFISQFPSADNYSTREMRFNMVCMEDAFVLRRTNCDELIKLIEITGKANPFAFQVSADADQMYFKRFCPQKKANVAKISAITTMVLNAKDITCIRDLYLNTYIKFYFTIFEFTRFIKERRPDLIEQIPNIFENTVFYAIADENGNLCIPWVEQNTIQVSKEFANLLLHCTISIDNYGKLTANVLTATKSDIFFEILQTCKLAGYKITPSMQTLLDEFLRLHSQDTPENTTIKKASSLNKNFPFEESLKFLRNQLRNKSFESKEFAKNISTLIRNYCHCISASDMENAISELTAEWIQRYPNTKDLRKYWYGTFLCFSGYYHSFGLGNILISQFYEFLYGSAAVSFEEKINTTITKLTAEFENFPSLEQALSEIKATFKTDDFKFSSFPKKIQKIVNSYKALVTAEEMKDLIASLTAEFIQLYPYADEIKQPLFSIHQSFYSTYKSGSLGLAICEQFNEYLYGVQSIDFEIQVKNTLSPTKTISTTPKNKKINKEPIQIITAVPFDTNVDKVWQMLYEEDFDPRIFIKYIRKLIQKYSESVSEEVMFESLISLLTQFLQQVDSTPANKTYLIGVHTCYSSFYKSNKLGLELCEMVKLYFDENLANNFILSFKKLEAKEK